MGKLKLLRDRFFEILPVEDTQLVIVDVAENIKPNKNLIKLNYAQLSVFKNGDFVFYKSKSKLYIWFTPRKLEKKLYIPEAFLIYDSFKEKRDVLVLKKIGEKTCVLVIKNRVLIAQFCKNGELDGEYLEVIEKKYALDRVDVVEFSAEETLRVKLHHIQRFLHSLDLDIKDFTVNFYNTIKVPVIVALFLINVYGLSMYFYVSSQVKKSKNELLSLRKENKNIKKKFEILKEESKFFSSFIDSEFKFPSFPETLNLIAGVVLKNGGKIRMYNQYQGEVDIEVISPSTSSIAKALLLTKFFKDVQILSASQYFKDKTKEIGRLRLLLKEKKHG